MGVDNIWSGDLMRLFRFVLPPCPSLKAIGGWRALAAHKTLPPQVLGDMDV